MILFHELSRSTEDNSVWGGGINFILFLQLLRLLSENVEMLSSSMDPRRLVNIIIFIHRLLLERHQKNLTSKVTCTSK